MHQVTLPGGVQPLNGGTALNAELASTPQPDRPAMTGTPQTIEKAAKRPQPRTNNRRDPENLKRMIEKSRTVTQNPVMMQTVLGMLGPQQQPSAPSIGTLMQARRS